jgi:hypothetical protein
MTMQVSQLPNFNPVAAGFPLAPQGYGPDEQLPLGDGYGDESQMYGLGRYGDESQMYGLQGRYGYYGLGQNGYGDKVKTWVAENPYMALGAGVVGGIGLYYAWMMYQQRMAY